MLRQYLIARNGSYKARQDLTSALETALGCNIRNFNCIFSDMDDPLDSEPLNNNFEAKSMLDLHGHDSGTFPIFTLISLNA